MIVRFKYMSTGVAFLIPVMVGGVSIVQLKPKTSTSNNNKTMSKTAGCSLLSNLAHNF